MSRAHSEGDSPYSNHESHIMTRTTPCHRVTCHLHHQKDYPSWTSCHPLPTCSSYGRYRLYCHGSPWWTNKKSLFEGEKEEVKRGDCRRRGRAGKERWKWKESWREFNTTNRESRKSTYCLQHRHFSRLRIAFIPVPMWFYVMKSFLLSLSRDIYVYYF